jgi:hypothetical protein
MVHLETRNNVFSNCPKPEKEFFPKVFIIFSKKYLKNPTPPPPPKKKSTDTVSRYDEPAMREKF